MPNWFSSGVEWKHFNINWLLVFVYPFLISRATNPACFTNVSIHCKLKIRAPRVSTVDSTVCLGFNWQRNIEQIWKLNLFLCRSFSIHFQCFVCNEKWECIWFEFCVYLFMFLLLVLCNIQWRETSSFNRRKIELLTQFCYVFFSLLCFSSFFSFTLDVRWIFCFHG